MRLPHLISEDLRRIAFLLALSVVVSVYFCIRQMPGWLRSRRSLSWPLAQGMVERVSVNVVAGQALGELAYSYTVCGEWYSGYHLQQFADEQDAWDRIDPLNGQPILVRYQPGHPDRCAVLHVDQSSLFTNKHDNWMIKLMTRHLSEIFHRSR